MQNTTRTNRPDERLRVFVVEDSPLVCERLEELVASVPGSRSVGHASRADTAIAAILAETPDVVVLDLNLEAGTGFDVLRALQAAAPQIDVYVLSNFSAEAHSRLARRLGARETLDKTTQFERVRDLLAARAATLH
ncbi:MAG TPA: response regulator [Burkholderiales bacterium]